MKLVKSTKQNSKDGRCCAIKNGDGKRCTRTKIFADGLCKQHYEIQKKITKHLNQYTGLLEQVPDIPPTLTGDDANRWVQICQHLLGLNALYAGLLTSVMQLIIAEQMRKILSEDLRNGNFEKYLNYYTTESGDHGNQVNGIYSLLAYYESQAKQLRKELSLTTHDAVKLDKATAPKRARQSKPLTARSAKSF